MFDNTIRLQISLIREEFIDSELNHHFEQYRNTDSVSHEGLSEPRTKEIRDILKDSGHEIKLHVTIGHFIDHSWKGNDKYICMII